jgi:beta-glucosidase/6-phospho-beta-glucosidase/beta-galactosidase
VARRSGIQEGDLETIAAGSDFIGVNYYTRRVMRAAPDRDPFPWEGRQPRANGSHAAHVVEILDAIRESFERGGSTVDVHSDFERPAPMEWAK